MSRREGLLTSQKWLQDAILGAEPSHHEAAIHITPSAALEPHARLEIYRSAYRARLVECLRDDYPVLARALDAAHQEEAFATLAQAFVDVNPSHAPNLNAYGRPFATFCRTRSELSGFYAELAELEWAMVEVIHAETCRGLEPAQIADLEAKPERWPQVRFAASEAVRLLHFEYATHAFYQACMTEALPSLPLRGVFPTPTAAAVLVYRQGAKVWRMPLSSVMVRILKPLLNGEALGETLDHLDLQPEEVNDVTANLGVWFREWVRAGIFRSLQVPIVCP